MSSNTAVVIVVILTLWLAAITVLIAALARYVGTLAKTGSSISGEMGVEPPFRVDDDGPAVPSDLSVDTVREIEAAGVQPNSAAILILFSIGCAPCEERIHEISELTDKPPIPLYALLAGPRDKTGTNEILVSLSRAGITTIMDPAAHALAKLIGIQSVPFAVLVENNTVIAKSYLRRGSDLATMWNSRNAIPTRGVRNVNSAAH